MLSQSHVVLVKGIYKTADTTLNLVITSLAVLQNCRAGYSNLYPHTPEDVSRPVYHALCRLLLISLVVAQTRCTFASLVFTLDDILVGKVTHTCK